MNSLTRRNFLASASTAVAGTALLPKSLAGFAQDAVTDVPRSNRAGGYEKVFWKAQPFPMTAVRLRSGPMKTAQDINLRYLNSIPNDRLLHMFRVTAGLPSHVEPLGGWEDPKCELRGHFAGGHYLSACALMYASTGDEAIRDKGNALVAELAKCQKANGYLGAYPEDFYDRLKNHQKVWAPFYTYHKIMAGHVDMYVHCGNKQALATAEKMAGWTSDWLKPISDADLQRILNVEYGGMQEVLFNLYALTGKQEYAQVAQRFSKKKFFDPLASGQDDLAGIHANTHIPQVIGAARGYELTGDARFHQIADYFWHQCVGHHTYATGGTSNGEFWQAPDKLANQLGPAAEECCCSYNMMKLSRHVFGWNPDARVMDYYERLLFNVRLGTQDPDGMLMYYVPLKPGFWKTFGTPYRAFWCCTGTGVEEYSKTNDSIYFHDDDSIYVNLFIGSEVDWKEKGVRLVQDTNFPEEEGTALTVKAAKATPLALKIRIPYWATEGVQIKVNGKAEKADTAPSSYAEIRRTWHDGDKVEVTLPMHLHTSPLPDDQTLQAAMYGPLVLAAQMGREGLTQKMIYGDYGPDEKHENIPMPEVSTAANQPTGWFEKTSGGELKFQTVGQSKQTNLIPLYKLLDERYSVYWKVNTKSV
jgi:DUF1680 family protein